MVSPGSRTDLGDERDPEDLPPRPDRYVFIQRPRCPQCESLDLQTTKSKMGDDCSRMRWTRCRSCNHRFIVVAE